jgi:rubredoxin
MGGMIHYLGMDSLPFQYQKRDFWEFYCPVCKAQRRSFYWPSPRPKHYTQFAVFAAILTGSLWSFFGFKGLFLNIPVWGFFEFFYRARARQSLICPHCGFDPYLYKHDVKLARQKMNRFWEKRNPRRVVEEKKHD